MIGTADAARAGTLVSPDDQLRRRGLDGSHPASDLLSLSLPGQAMHGKNRRRDVRPRPPHRSRRSLDGVLRAVGPEEGIVRRAVGAGGDVVRRNVVNGEVIVQLAVDSGKLAECGSLKEGGRLAHRQWDAKGRPPASLAFPTSLANAGKMPALLEAGVTRMPASRSQKCAKESRLAPPATLPAKNNKSARRESDAPGYPASELSRLGLQAGLAATPPLRMLSKVASMSCLPWSPLLL